jgi:MFS family permease
MSGRDGLAAALVATTLVQAVATMAVYLLPVLAPAASRDLGVAPGLIGVQVALVYGTAALASIGSGSVLSRLGPARCSQAALLAAAAGAAALAAGGIAAAAIASVLLGIGYGLITPAATQLLARMTPPTRRNLVFSIKQMGVPLGGTLAGLALPGLALTLGWRGAAFGTAALLAILAMALLPFRASWDAWSAGGPAQPRLGTIQALRAGRGLPALAAMGACFSAIQLSLAAFAVTTLVGEFGWGPVAAGAAAAAAQASGAASRLVFALFADRLRAGLPILAATGFCAALAALAMPFAPRWPDAMVLLLFCGFGTCVAGWTGIAMAEVARLAPPGQAGAATGGVMAVTYVGVVVGPTAFGGLAAIAGSYTIAFAAMSALPLLGACVALRAWWGLRLPEAGR